MEQLVPIRSVKQYMKEYIYTGLIENHSKPAMVREQLLDAFQKEVFGQIVFKYKDAAILSREAESVSEEVREGCRHIIENANRKWRRLCIECARYPETRMMIDQKDLNERLRDIIKIQEKERKD